MGVPDKLINFKCYNDGGDMIGIADVVMPNLAYMTESMQGAGIAGEIDSPTVGHFQSLTTTINWRSLVEENIHFTAPITYHFDFRGSVSRYNEDTGEFEPRAIKAVMRVKPKNFNLGNLGVATQMGTNAEFEVIYLNFSIEGKEWVEIDKFSFICRIDGVDYLAKTRKDLGIS
jgi:P2 family phage contractile tail tube protein